MIMPLMEDPTYAQHRWLTADDTGGAVYTQAAEFERIETGIMSAVVRRPKQTGTTGPDSDKTWVSSRYRELAESHRLSWTRPCPNGLGSALPEDTGSCHRAGRSCPVSPAGRSAWMSAMPTRHRRSQDHRTTSPRHAEIKLNTRMVVDAKRISRSVVPLATGATSIHWRRPDRIRLGVPAGRSTTPSSCG